MKEKHETRRAQLVKLIGAKPFSGSQAAFAQHVGIVDNLVSRYVNGRKGIGEDMRKKIERKCGLDDGWLDATIVGSELPALTNAIEAPSTEWTLQSVRTLMLSQPAPLRKHISELLVSYINEHDDVAGKELSAAIDRMMQRGNKTAPTGKSKAA